MKVIILSRSTDIHILGISLVIEALLLRDAHCQGRGDSVTRICLDKYLPLTGKRPEKKCFNIKKLL